MKLIVDVLKEMLPKAFLPITLAVSLCVGVAANYFWGDDSLVEQIAEEVVSSLLGDPEFEFDFSQGSEEKVKQVAKEKAEEKANNDNLAPLSEHLMQRIVKRAEEKLISSD